MALNLWKIGGQPTSYNPLPIGTNNYVDLPKFNDYIVTFKAKSISNAILNVSSYSSVSDLHSDIILTTDFKSYSFTWKESDGGRFWIVDKNNIGDIIIDSIELNQKPLPKLTINGIDGFLSGKWTLHPNAQVVDDDTLVLNATAINQHNLLLVDVIPNQAYVLSLSEFNGKFGLDYCDRNGVYIDTSGWKSSSFSFVTPNNCYQLKIFFSSADVATGSFIFKRPILNLGSIQAPYSKKTGNTMVMPTPKKNLFDGALESGTYGGSGQKTSYAGTIRTVNKISVKPNLSYSLSVVDNNIDNLQFYNADGSFLSYSGVLATKKSGSFTTPNGCYFLAFSMLGSSFIDSIQLEEGTTATPYEPYAVQVDKKPQHAIVQVQTGLSFNGVTDYLELPSMTMDSIEIECLIDSVQPNGNPYILDARPSTANGYFSLSALGSSWKQLLINDSISSVGSIPRNQRVKLRVDANSAFTGGLFILSANANALWGKAILYKVTCYLNGQVVAQYDFENPQNIVDNKVLPNAKNLIPSFEDARWNIHPNAKVLGKDVLHLNATDVHQQSRITLPVKANTNYYLSNGGNGFVLVVDKSESNVLMPYNVGGYSFNTGSFTEIIIVLSNVSIVGTFDFIKTQLYELSGNEGTINGAPQAQRKQAKRVLYAKR